MDTRDVTGPRTAFVTGGSGFVGGHLLERLIRDGWTVRALARSDRAVARVTELGAEPVAGDLAAIPLDRLRGADVAFHLAALVDEWAPPGTTCAPTSTAPRRWSPPAARPGWPA